MSDSPRGPLHEKIREMILKLNPGALEWLSDPAANLFSVGALDSYLVIHLVVAMEEKLAFTFDYTDLNAENFASLDSIAGLLKTKYKL